MRLDPHDITNDRTDAIIVVVAILLALLAIGMIEKYADLEREYVTLQQSAERCRMAQGVRP